MKITLARLRFSFYLLLVVSFSFAFKTLPVFAQTNGGFTSLSGVPAFTNAVTGGGNLSSFFNTLYMLSIGAVAIIAVLQIMRAGIMYMGSDVVTEKSQAKHLIRSSLFGLVLVLSPALIFSLINPNIIKNIGFDVGGLTVPASSGTGLPTGSTPPTTTGVLASSGVTQSVTGTQLQTATFSSTDADKNNQARDAWISVCQAQGNNGYSTGSSEGTHDTTVSGGTQTATNISATNATAVCGHLSSSKYTFVDTTGHFSSAVLKPWPSDAGAADSFINSCTTDGGVVCPSSVGGSYVSVTCPSTGSVTLSSSATGNCYQATLICRPNAIVSQQCGTSATIQP
jgi:hypothetical protein